MDGYALDVKDLCKWDRTVVSMYNDFDTQSYGTMQYNEAVGVYTPDTQISIDVNNLITLGFNMEEIQTLQYIVMNGGKVTPSALTSYGLDYESAKKIKYMYDIATGKINIESTDDFSKHLRKLFGTHRRIGIQNLALSKLQSVPRKAVIGGIRDETFSIYNSNKYPVNERMYDVVNVTGGRIWVETSRKPVLKFKQAKKLENVIEIIELKQDGKVVVAVDKQYCKLCNRFIIVGSLRRPEFHNGMVEIICIEGTKVYVYANNMGVRESVSYNGGTQRVYDYGFLPNEIQPKLLKVASELYPVISGVYASTNPANSDYHILTPEIKEEDSIDDIIEE